MITINDDVTITLAGILTTTLIIMLMMMRNAVHRQRLKRCFDSLESAKRAKLDAIHFQALKHNLDPNYLTENHSLTTTFKLSVQIVFGITVLLAFSWWAYYLFTKNSVTWAFVSAMYAVIGLLLPFLIGREIKRRGEIKDRILHSVRNMEKSLEKSNTVSASRQDTAKISIPDTPSKYRAIDPINKICVPEDSVLRRHLLTQLRAEIEASLLPVPSDCVLQRHYKQLVEAKLQDRLLNPDALARFQAIESSNLTHTGAAPSPTKVVFEKTALAKQHAVTDSKYTVPEDAILRRHLLNEIRSKIESSLFPRPTDCVLLRHYQQLVESELEQRLVDPEKLNAYRVIDGIEQGNPSTVERNIAKTTNHPAVFAVANDDVRTLPEDSVLQRHFISQLRTEIESSLFPRPYESVLRRHYDQLIESELQMRLQ
ncbi:MAG: hypothetical protein Kow0065_04200 [Methylomicrobium sp.]